MDGGTAMQEFDAALVGAGCWNRYPGARCGPGGFHDSCSFSDEPQRERDRSGTCPEQPEIMRYLNFAADTFA